MSTSNAIDTSTTSKHARYDAYKDAGVDWLRDIPEHWRQIRLRYLVETSPSKTEVRDKPDDLEVSFVPMESVGTDGGLDLGETKELDDVIDGYTYFRDGDVLIAKITPCFENRKGALADGLVNGIGFGTTELHVLRSSPQLDNRFLFYATLTHPFRKMGESTMYGAGGQKRVSDDFIRNLRWPIPPLDEQRAIAAYLDRETERIDTLIDTKERLIDLLEEKRTALISRAVTKGLDVDVEMQDSGVEWLGEIPAGWEVMKLKYGLQSIEQGWSPQCESRQAGEDEWAVLKAGCVNGYKFDPAEHKALPSDTEPKPEYQVEQGDVLMSRANTRELLGSAVTVEKHYPKLLLCDKLYRLRIRENIDPHFLVAQLSSYVARYQMEQDATGASASMQNISQDTVLNLLFLNPPYQEQRRISNRLRELTHQIDLLLEKADEGIDRLKEYRTALISAAVTGQIDVRGEI